MVSLQTMKLQYTALLEAYPEVNAFVESVTGVNVAEVLRQEEEGNIIASIVLLIAIGVALMVYGIVLGNLEKPLSDAINDSSSFASLKTDVPSQLASAGKIATVIPIIAIAGIVIGIVYNIAR